MSFLCNTLKAGTRIARYQGTLLVKRLRAPFSSGPTVEDLDDTPPVTVFITSLNNRSALELALRTLMAHTAYPNYQILVADKASTDGSVEMVQGLIEQGAPIRLLAHKSPAPLQHESYEMMAATVDTPLWVGMHEDMMFLADDWLVDLVYEMQTRPELLILGGEYVPPRSNFTEPVGKKVVDLMEPLSTWLFCARADLRNHSDTPFAFHKQWSEERGRPILYDQGGRLIEDLREAGLGVGYMPPSYRNKYQHVSNLSWAFKNGIDDAVRRFKKHQIADIERRVRRLQCQPPTFQRSLADA